jgi:hypothetical protein
LVAKSAGHSSRPDWAAPSPVPVASNKSRWILIAAIVVAVAAAAVIGVVLLSGRDGGDGGSEVGAESATTLDGASSGSSGDTESTSMSSLPTEDDVTGDVSVVRASSCLNRYQGIDYVAWNLLDNSMETCWAEGVEGGYGIGETVFFKFSQRMTLTRMEVMPGYKKYDTGEGIDRWRANGRLKSITVTFADGSQETYPFSDSKTWQSCEFGEKTGTTLEFTIDSVYVADTGTDHDAEDTSVSEVRFYGWPASEGGE